MNIIIDTDVGVDDSLALALAIASGTSICGIATVFGNASVDNTTRNTLTILQLLKSTLPVYRGAATPLLGKQILPKSHGDNGLGGFSIPLQRKQETESAIEFYKRTLEHETNVTVICLGPVSNIALINSLFPKLARKIKKLIILGGVFFEKGNMSPVAEFNTINDPYALRNVLTIDCPKVIIPINVCRQVLMQESDFNRITNRKLKSTFQKITDLFIRYYSSDDEYAGFTGGVMYDLLAIAYALEPTLFTTEKGNVYVETGDNPLLGQTIFTPDVKSSCEIITACKPKEIIDLFFTTINTYADTSGD